MACEVRAWKEWRFGSLRMRCPPRGRRQGEYCAQIIGHAAPDPVLSVHQWPNGGAVAPAVGADSWAAVRRALPAPDYVCSHAPQHHSRALPAARHQRAQALGEIWAATSTVPPSRPGTAWTACMPGSYGLLAFLTRRFWKQRMWTPS